MINFKTDLADERRDIYRKANNLSDEIPGIETSEKQEDGIKTTKVKILNDEGANAIGKPIGSYITIDIKNLRIAQKDEIESAAQVLNNELKDLYNNHINNGEDILVVGLGNMRVTPDALGPRVINDIDVTRHLLNYAPQYLEPGTRCVSAISPGVLGTTGIETQEILQGIVEKIKPKLIIVIDSLASKSMERISSTIQIADTGIVPGAGVGNKRRELTVNTLGVPVIAIGVPTCVDAATLTSDCLDVFIEKLQEEAKSNDYLNNLKNEDKYTMIKEALLPKDFNFIVTPKEIDGLIENMSSVIARGINLSL